MYNYINHINQFTNTDIITISGGFVISTIIYYKVKFSLATTKLKEEIKKLKNEKTKIENELNPKDTITLLEFFDNILMEKFKYYFMSDILAYFSQGKELKKQEIIDIKEKFYVDISKMLSEDQKMRLLKIFSKQGIEIYIHQTFLKLLNESNIKYLDTSDNLDKRSLDVVYDINRNNTIKE